MARIRTIKPEFFTDEKLAFCTVYARFLFIGLWVFADDDGRMEYSPKRIAMQIFPGEATDALPLLAELIKHLLVRIYEVEGKSYLCIPGFDKHQKMRRKLPSRYPSPNDRVTDVVTDVPPMPGIVRTADALFRPVVEVVPEVVPEVDIEAKKPPKKRAHTLPEDFIPNDEHYEIGKELRLIVDFEFQKFRDHFLGNGGVKLNWDATFRNWLRNAPKYGGSNGRPNTNRPESTQRVNTQVSRWDNNDAEFERAFGAAVGTNTTQSGNGQAPRLVARNPGTVEGEIKKLP